MYSWLERTLGAEWSRCAWEDRGDGVLMLWPLSTADPVPPKVVVSRLLALPETAPAHPRRPRLRVAIHIGQVFKDERGFSGSAVEETFGLNEAETLKASLAGARGPVAYLLSEDVHKAVIRYGYDDFDPSAFHSTLVKTKRAALDAWLHVPAENELAASLAAQGAEHARRPATRPAERPAEPEARQVNGVHFTVGGDADFSGSTIGGRDVHR